MAKKSNKNVNETSFMTAAQNMLNYLHNHVLAMNQSKIFAGIMIVIINIASKFVTFKLSKTMESYLKFTFSRDVLVFAITWMGTRDIYIALIMTTLFMIIVDFLLNENSAFCCLPSSFVNKHVSMLEGMTSGPPTQEEIVKAELVLKRAKESEKLNTNLEDANFNEAYKPVDENNVNMTGVSNGPV
jgi:hypothetical protein